MEIKPYSHYCESEILPLYRAVGWSNYFDHPEMLKNAYQNSLCILCAYDNDKLVGIIRAVGDGYSIVFIQDLLVDPNYQNKGIGTALMKAMIQRYAQVYQMELAADNTKKTVGFYKSLGFVPLDEIGCCGFMRA